MADRRYNDKEVAEIFRSASEGLQLPRKQESVEKGLSLADLQSIAGQVGISSDAVVQAATALDVRKGSSQRTLLGLPIGVSRSIDLDRRLTDEEWARLVVQLQEVFDAQGKTNTEGSIRQWSNGNLRVVLEPTESGQRLRLRTFNSGARTSITTGLLLLGITAALAAATALTGNLAHAASGVWVLGFGGLGMFANGALRLPAWARLRGRQMESIGAQLALPQLPPESPASLPPSA